MNSQTLSFQNFPVTFSQSGYLYATAIAEHFGKRINNYLRNERTQEYMQALCDTRKSVSLSDLIIVKKGNSKSFKQGTWLHPKLAVDFARWLDPRFAVWCDEQIEQILSGSLKLEPVQPALPAVTLSDNTLYAIGCVLMYAQDMRLFVRRYLPAFENLGLERNHALWSFAHDSEEAFAPVRSFFFSHLPQNKHMREYALELRKQIQETL